MATAASASLSLLPPKPQISSKRHENQRRLLLRKLSRRDAALLSFLALVPSAPASAFSVGICKQDYTLSSLIKCWLISR